MKLAVRVAICYCSRQFQMMLGLLTVFSLLGSTGRVGNQLVSLRAV